MYIIAKIDYLRVKHFLNFCILPLSSPPPVTCELFLMRGDFISVLNFCFLCPSFVTPPPNWLKGSILDHIHFNIGFTLVVKIKLSSLFGCCVVLPPTCSMNKDALKQTATCI